MLKGNMEMLSRWTFELETMEGQKPSVQWGPMLHGALMKLLPCYIVERLHEQRMQPFAQYIEPRFDGCAVWHVHLFGDIFQGTEEILANLSELRLTNRAFVAVRNRQVESISKAEFFTNVRRVPNHDHCEIHFKTPCTHKSQGEYLKFPSLPLIFRNLHSRAKEVFSELYENNENDMALGEAVRILRYSLASAPFFIKETPIVGYTGFLRLELPDATELSKQAQTLLELAKYTGIGAKTALGMGGVKILWRDKKRDSRIVKVCDGQNQ